MFNILGYEDAIEEIAAAQKTKTEYSELERVTYYLSRIMSVFEKSVKKDKKDYKLVNSVERHISLNSDLLDWWAEYKTKNNKPAKPKLKIGSKFLIDPLSITEYTVIRTGEMTHWKLTIIDNKGIMSDDPEMYFGNLATLNKKMYEKYSNNLRIISEIVR